MDCPDGWLVIIRIRKNLKPTVKLALLHLIALGPLLWIGFSIFNASTPPSASAVTRTRLATIPAITGTGSTARDNHQFSAKSVQADDKLEKDKLRYFAENKIPVDKLVNPPASPLFSFWADRLMSGIEENSDDAFEIFAIATSESLGILPKNEWSEDLKAIKSATNHNYWLMRDAAGSLKYGLKINIEGVESIKKIITASQARLQRPDQASMALQVLNQFTMDVYSDKDAAWWSTQYSHSKMAAIFDGESVEEWIHFKE